MNKDALTQKQEAFALALIPEAQAALDMANVQIEGLSS